MMSGCEEALEKRMEIYPVRVTAMVVPVVGD